MLGSRLVLTLAAFVSLTACAADPETHAESDADAQLRASPFAPSGMYAIDARVLADDCAPPHAAPMPWQARVLVRAESGKAKVNLPLSALSASGPAAGISRSDFVLEPGYTVEHSRTPKPGCDDFAIDATIELTSATREGFVIETTLAYGDAAACAVPGPSECTTRIAHTYTLVEATCPAECTQGERPTTPGLTVGVPHWEIECRCPD